MTRHLLLLSMVLLGACTHRALPIQPDDEPLEARRYQVRIAAHDGVTLGATLWQPALAAGETAPLVMHSHGFGLQRMDGRFGLYENIIPSGQVAKKLWQQGFWLLTWDQRGHGDTGGDIDVMNPSLEVRDVSTLLDWAQENISRLSRDADGDIRVGMVGESYGAGVQLLASVKDPRIDAIVPITTWYDLDSALAPQQVPKGGWIKTLYLIGDWWNFRHLNPAVRHSFHQARRGEIDAQFRQDYADHSLKYYCDRNQMPGADALLIQGLRDMLFDVDQSLKMQACFQRAGKDVNLIVQTGGHLLPMEQHSPSMPVWYWDKTLQCASAPLDTESVAVQWLQAKLADSQAPVLPPVCVSDVDWGVALNAWPTRYQQIELPAVSVSGDGSGGWRWLTRAGDWFSGWRSEASLSQQFAISRDAGTRPAFIPLHTADITEQRFGTPKLHLHSETEIDVPILAALVVRRAGQARLRLVDDQVAPVMINQDAQLPPVAITLEPGDQLGLALFSRHPQFNTRKLDFSAGLTIDGSFSLPVSVQQLQAAKDPSLLNLAPESVAATASSNAKPGSSD